MTTTGLDGIDTTVHKTNIWLKAIMEELDWQDKNRAYIALRAVLHSLRDRLPIEEAADLGAQLPMLIRGIYYEAWNPCAEPAKCDKECFLASVRDAFINEPGIDAEAVARGVFRVLEKQIAAGEINDIKAVLPKELAQLW